MSMKVIKTESGFAALIALIMVVMLTLLGMAALSTSDDELTITSNELQEMKAFYAAEAGLEKAAAALQAEYDSTGVPPVNLPNEITAINNCAVSYSVSNDGPATQKTLTNGTMAGLHALVKSFTMTSTANNPEDHATVRLSQSFEAALVPIFQFAVFYGEDLEIAPGPDMTLMGRVHSNGNMWIQSGSSLKMDSYVTASGHILHGRKGAGTVSQGDVLIKDADGNYHSMKGSFGWLDSMRPYWYDSSVTWWQGRVQDSTHGQGPLNLPLSGGAGSDPHKLIERASGNSDSYENKATLKFIDHTAYKMVGGVWTDVTADMVSKGIISFADNKFYDGRDKKDVDVMELDIDKLYNEGYAPPNGVIYYSDQDASRDFPALRIINGAELGSGLTIASENPVYTKGNYNSVNKKPSAILADAVSFLSNSWNDANSWSSISSRVASNTVVNTSYMTGNIETDHYYYNGGFENLPRFLEKWSGKRFTWKGSAVCLWESIQAGGKWSYGQYYTAPIRDWSYDSDLDDPNKLPPETPVVRVFQRTGWKQDYVGYDS